jgi:Xaa-Pro aminopeptidase
MKKQGRTAAVLLAGFVLAVLAVIPAAGQTTVLPRILTFREQVATVNRITLQRLDRILPAAMDKAGFDMWIIVSNEDNLDPVFKTMIPMDVWCPIVQILVFSKTPGRPIERLNLSRTDMKGLHKDAWDWRAWDSEKKESQWDALARVVRERDPKTIAINESEEIWAAGGLTTALKDRLAAAVGPIYAKRFRSAVDLATLWLETLLDEELDLYERAVSISHALIAEALSGRAITPGVTTTDDLLYYFNQRVVDLGLKLFAWPTFRIRYRDPKAVERLGASDNVIRPGDFVVTDAGIEYLRYYTDFTEWAYVLRPGETDVPAGVRAVMAEANRLQDVFLGEFKEGRSGNEILAAILATAKAKGIPGPRIYSHSIGLFLHEPGPLIGLPWEQVDTGVRGRVKLVPNSTFTAELSVAAPVPEWDGRELRLSQEQVVAYTSRGAYILDGRQTRFHLVK